MPWGIAETASEIEKIKAESSDKLGGLNSVGEIDYTTYSILWDFFNDLLEKAYKQGLKDASTVDAVPVEWMRQFKNAPVTDESAKRCDECGGDFVEWMILEWEERKENEMCQLR